MKRFFLLLISSLVFFPAAAVSPADSVAVPVRLTLEDALKIALSENVSVKVADKEIEKTGYARKGTYSALFPKIDFSGTFQRTIKKQVMYMDFDLGGLSGIPGMEDMGGGNNDGFEVGRWNTWSAGVNASLPLVNAQLWKSLKIADTDVELAVEKARSSRLDMVTTVKQSFFACLLAKESFAVLKSVYDNALENMEQTQRKYNVQKASDLDMARAKTALANAIPNMFDAENSCQISLWQLKAVMGIDLDTAIDVEGSLSDYASKMEAFSGADGTDLGNNPTMRQLALQAEELADAVKMQQYASLPSLALAFSYSMNAMTNDFNFSEYKWSPYSYVALSLSIPIFAGGKRASSVKQARVQAEELALQRSETERQLRIGIRQYINTMDTATKSYASAQSAVESATKAYDIASKSYNVGRSTLTDLNDAQLALTQARMSVAQAVYSYQVAKANLEKLIGADFLAEDGTVDLNKAL